MVVGGSGGGARGQGLLFFFWGGGGESTCLRQIDPTMVAGAERALAVFVTHGVSPLAVDLIRDGSGRLLVCNGFHLRW